MDELQRAAGTSIFDPVLCELACTWFCPPGGKVLDPFAGGSVRGIVAVHLGREYVGVELRPEQVEANRLQAEQIFATPEDGMVAVAVSGKWARHRFPCAADYIVVNCHGRCCEGTDDIVVSLLPDEVEWHEQQGYIVKGGMLQANAETRKCPHKLANGLCSVHGTAHKPFGCIVSPFTLNKSGTLIIRHRYSLLKCHGQGDVAYRTFRASLDLILGHAEAERVCIELDKGADKVGAAMPRASYDRLLYLDSLKHGAIAGNMGKYAPRWIVGDAANVKKLAAGEYDFLFSCPPYYDLEVYSDLDGELSALSTYDEFIAQYHAIVADCVDMLKDDRFACFCVGDIRDKHGLYRNFVSDTIAAFQDAGMPLYNEAILVTAVGSLPIRAGRQFEAGRKLGKTHQNVLVFVKGDWRKATEACGDVEVAQWLGPPS